MPAEKGSGIYQRKKLNKSLGGDPATKERANVRKECKPEGPVGLLLESIHLQAAALDETLTIVPQDTYTIDIAEAPIQQLAPLTRQLATTNRTRRACGTRWETEGLEEIDLFATMGEHKGKMKKDYEQITLNMTMAGSIWTRVAIFWTGKSDDKVCQLCLEGEETPDHIWRCRRLRTKAKELDEELAEMDPGKFANSMLMGVAPAMSGDTRKTFWGTDPDEKLEQEYVQSVWMPI